MRSLGLEHRDEIHLEEKGVLEDRRFFVIDETNRLIDQLIAGTMVQVKAWTDPDATVLRLTFPDGTVVEDAVRLGDAIETAIHSRTGGRPHRRRPVGRGARRDFLGRDVRIVRCDQPGGTRRAHPATLVTDGSIEALAGVLGAGAIDARRFRMLIELEGGRAHEEDTWVGCRVGLGEAILRISAPVPRCAMTTHDPETGHRDLDTLRAIKDYRGLVDGKDLMFGVWGEVERPGTIRLGDQVQVLID